MELPGQRALSRDYIFRPIRSQPPQEKANIADVVPALVLTRVAHIYRVAHEVKRAVQTVYRLRAAQVGAAGAVQAEVIEVLIPNQELKKFDGVGGPAGDVARQLFEHRERALAAPVIDGLGDVGARADRVGRTQIRSREIVEKLTRRIRRLQILRVVE